ncbi:YidH family protein [Caulobacter sp. 17J80-11]|uniref:YidH family protein n=1 Tax=Caulobacter sp. 17J80-11 TaxID=2763502 RepID=UPI001653C0ED|nr:DUF202 domain-containing protein [Caulobacter sp. 17J80-11]MBC6983672.1 DUF202 domain-containing protein [Caulobacter sp. 17J80-11]
MADPTPPTSDVLIGGDASTTLSSNRTALSFERTRMSADRTLMSVVRTALSLIGFGFTISEAFHQLHKAGSLAVGDHSARNFGLALILLGVAMLVMGLVTHSRFSHELTDRRERLYSAQLMRRSVQYRMTPTFITTALLLAIGVAAALSILIRIAYNS